MRFYDRLIAETEIDNNIKDMLRTSRLISGDNILQYCLEYQTDLTKRIHTIPMIPSTKSMFIDINNAELLNQINTEELGFPNKIKSMGIFSHAYTIDDKNLNALSMIIDSSYQENIRAIQSSHNISKKDLIESYISAMIKYEIKWVITRFVIIELESSNLMFTSFMSTIVTNDGFYPNCDISSTDPVEFAIATLSYNFSLPTVLYSPRGDDINKIYAKIQERSINDLLESKTDHSKLIEQTPYGNFVELINMIHNMTTGLLNCKNVNLLTLDAEQIYPGSLRRKYLRHHDHKLSNFDLIQIFKKNEVPQNKIKKGYFRTFTPDKTTIGGNVGSYWYNTRELTKK